jgi:hypothetical protein
MLVRFFKAVDKPPEVVPPSVPEPVEEKEEAPPA